MPNNIESWVAMMNRVPPEFAGVLMAMFMALLRIIYDHQETKPMRVLLEMAICGALSLTASHGIYAMGLNHNLAIFSGGAIGFLGSLKVRSFALKFIKKKSGTD